MKILTIADSSRYESKIMYNKILILFTVTTLAGCASTPPKAVVRVPGTYTALVLPVVTDKWAGGVVQLASKDKYGCGRFSANAFPNPAVEDFSVDIEGNRDIFFRIARTDAFAECSKVGMFYATKGNTYTARFEIKNNQCEFSLSEKTPGGAQNKISTYAPYVSNVDGIKVCENKEKLY